MGRQTVSVSVGDKFGRLEVISTEKGSYSLCKCQCGIVKELPNSKVVNYKSCGKCPQIWILGMVFGKFKVINYLHDTKDWEVVCECGTVCARKSSVLRKGDTTHCGCSPKLRSGKDITGKKIGKLTALRSTDSKCSNGDYLWEFLCDCGVSHITSIGRFNSGHTKSCGCLIGDLRRGREDYHGKSLSPEYKSWLKMRERCLDETCKDYPSYGGSGIGICKEWKDFKVFFKDMGEKPFSDASVDRKNREKGYSKENCRWASPYVQARNRIGLVRTSKYKGVQYEESSGKWVASISLGNIKAKKIGRYLSEHDAAAAYNLATNMIFGEGSKHTLLNEIKDEDTKVNTDCKFFKHWVFEMIKLKNKLYEE